MNNEDMSELFNKVSSMVNEGNIPDDMKNILSSFALGSNNSGNSKAQSTSGDTPSIDADTILKMKSIIEKMNSSDDPRANLLKSLKPYLKESRKDKIDQYIKLFKMSKAMEALGDFRR